MVVPGPVSLPLTPPPPPPPRSSEKEAFRAADAVPEAEEEARAETEREARADGASECDPGMA